MVIDLLYFGGVMWHWPLACVIRSNYVEGWKICIYFLLFLLLDVVMEMDFRNHLLRAMFFFNYIFTCIEERRHEVQG